MQPLWPELNITYLMPLVILFLSPFIGVFAVRIGISLAVDALKEFRRLIKG